MSAKKKVSRRYAVCIKNAGNEASLERNKIYVALPDRAAAADGLVRVIDEYGEVLVSTDRGNTELSAQFQVQFLGCRSCSADSADRGVGFCAAEESPK